jgi:hypothetical protein
MLTRFIHFQNFFQNILMYGVLMAIAVYVISHHPNFDHFSRGGTDPLDGYPKWAYFLAYCVFAVPAHRVVVGHMEAQEGRELFHPVVRFVVSTVFSVTPIALFIPIYFAGTFIKNLKARREFGRKARIQGWRI